MLTFESLLQVFQRHAVTGTTDAMNHGVTVRAERYEVFLGINLVVTTSLRDRVTMVDLYKVITQPGIGDGEIEAAALANQMAMM